MADTARVFSIDALKDFREALLNFAEEAKQALTAQEMQARRTIDWLQHDQNFYWQGQIKRRREQVSSARAEWHRYKLTQMTSENSSHGWEQREALRLAEARLRAAEEALKRLKNWVPAVQHAASEYQGQARGLADFLEVDLKRAVALLDRMIASLEDYVRTSSPSANAGGTP